MNKKLIAQNLVNCAKALLAIEFDSEDAMKEYLKDHPEADKSLHTVKKQEKNRVVKEEGKIPQGLKLKFTQKERALPDKALNKFKNKEEAFKSAKTAQDGMMNWLDRGKGIDKKLGLKHFDIGKGENPDFSKKGPILITAPLKSEERATEKVNAEEGGDWSRLTDMVRATIAVDDFDSIGGVIESLRESGMKLASKPTDRFTNPTVAGYRDIKLNVDYGDGHIGELQVHTKAMLEAKEEAHKLYEQVRSISAKAQEAGRKEMTELEQEAVDKANKEMEAVYNAAWVKSKGKVDSKAASIIESKTESRKTFYLEYKGKAVKVEYRKFPILFVNGKEKIFYDLFELFTHGAIIDKKKFDELSEK